MRPADRLERLLAHVRRFWARVRGRPDQCAQARAWLVAHPNASWPLLDELWSDALVGEGALFVWLEAGAHVDTWQHPEASLHSVLSSHPFAALDPW